MPRAPPPGFFVITAIVLFVWYILWAGRHFQASNVAAHVGRFPVQKPATTATVTTLDTTSGNAIMGKLGNETAKAELGRAAWKLFHTVMARFPDKPTTDESQALKDYIHLFARLYPCGECAQHFQQIIKQYPPQVSSRSSAAGWACFVHNEVNISKGKPVFDCANIGDWYDCGCADDEKESKSKQTIKTDGLATGKDTVEIQKDGLMNGG